MFIAAMQENEPVITNTQDGCDKTTNSKIFYEKNAIRQESSKSSKYYLPQVLQDHINTKTDLSIDFSADRFKIDDEEAMVERR